MAYSVAGSADSETFPDADPGRFNEDVLILVVRGAGILPFSSIGSQFALALFNSTVYKWSIVLYICDGLATIRRGSQRFYRNAQAQLIRSLNIAVGAHLHNGEAKWSFPARESIAATL